MSEFKTKRYLFGTMNGEYENLPLRETLNLYLFADGENDAYGIVAYLMWNTDDAYKMYVYCLLQE